MRVHSGSITKVRPLQATRSTSVKKETYVVYLLFYFVSVKMSAVSMCSNTTHAVRVYAPSRCLRRS